MLGGDGIACFFYIADLQLGDFDSPIYDELVSPIQHFIRILHVRQK